MENLCIGENIKKYRIMAGLTQAELATELSKLEGKNIAPSAIAGYESGQRVPKVEMRVQIARILGVDPVALSGIELDDNDEKRLLCKLLYKYAKDMSLAEDGEVTVKLSDDFAGFQMEYEENKERLEFLYEDTKEDSLMREISKQTVDAEMEYWMENFPKLDAAYLCKQRNVNCTVDDMRSFREMIKAEMEDGFVRYQNTYLNPMMNKEIIDKIRKR